MRRVSKNLLDWRVLVLAAVLMLAGPFSGPSSAQDGAADCIDGEACESEAEAADEPDNEGPALQDISHFFKAGALLDICTGDEVEQIACRLYIAGIYDAAEFANWQYGASGRWCAIGGASASQMQDIVVAYITLRPQFHHLPAAWAIDGALTEAFSCENFAPLENYLSQ